MSNRELASLLLPRWNSTAERFGVVLRSGEIVELPNLSDSPFNAAVVSRQGITDLGDEVCATWHTHTHNRVNLSSVDYATFLSLPHLLHFIVTETRVRSFSVRNNKVMLHEADCI